MVRVKYKQIILFIVTLMMVLYSKTIYFGIINRATYQWIFYGVCIIGLAFCTIKKNVLKENLMVLFPFLVFYVLNAVFYWDQLSSSSLNQMIGELLNYIVVALAASYLNREEFSNYYLQIIAFFAAVSLVCVTIANVSQNLAYAFCQPGYDWKTSYGYSVLYMWGWNGTISTRNAGPFWEPGAFQGFLLLAELMLIYRTDGGRVLEKNRMNLMILLVVTLVTTRSTTGYILQMLLFVTHYRKYIEVFSRIPTRIRKTLIGFLIVLVIVVIIQSGNILDKLNATNTNSVSIRTADFVGGLTLMFNRPLIGLGVTRYRDIMRMAVGVNAHDSVGLISLGYHYGIPFFICFVYRVLKGGSQFFEGGGRHQKATLIIFFLILHCTEGLTILPVYVYLLFFRSKNTAIKELMA